MVKVMFCCGSALEAQRAGTRAAPNKNKTKQAAHFHPRDVRRLMRGGGWRGGGGGWGGGAEGWRRRRALSLAYERGRGTPLASVKHALFPHEIDDDGVIVMMLEVVVVMMLMMVMMLMIVMMMAMVIMMMMAQP